MRTGGTRRTVARAATVAVVAALAVGGTGPVAHAEQAEVDVRLRADDSTSVLVNEPVGFGFQLEVPDPSTPTDLTVTVTVDFSRVIDSIERPDGPDRCDWRSPRYVCDYDFKAGSTPTNRPLSFGVAPRSGATWTTGRVRAIATVSGATDPNTANNTLDYTLDVRTDRADVAAELAGPSYRLVGDGAGDLTVNVRTPNPGKRVTLAATFDFRDVQHAVSFTPDDPDECWSLGNGRLRCEQEVNGSGRTSATLVASHMFWMSPGSGGPTGPAGKVRVSVEQVGGVDPNPSNNSVSATLDVVRGQWLGTVDFGDVTGRVGETVTAPVTITNPGPNTFQYIAIAHTPRYGGVELVGYEGCAPNPYAPSGYCAAPPWFAAGSTYRVGIHLKITRCPDSDGVGGAVAASKATVEFNDAGRLTVSGCAGSAPSTGGGGHGAGVAPAGTTPDGATPDGAAADTTPPPAPAGALPASTPGAPAAATGGPAGAPSDAAGDWVPVGQPRPDTGLGLTGLILLLGLLATVRSGRWAFVRHTGAQ
jgi:hypothetical protein